MANLFKSIGNVFTGAVKTVAKVGGTVLNTAGKIAAVSGLPLISSAGAVVDALIPDKSVAMVQAVQNDGYIDVAKVENTVSSENPTFTPAAVNNATQAIVSDLQTVTGVSAVNDAGAVTKIPGDSTFVSLLKKYWWVPVGLIVIYMIMKPKSRRRRW